MRRKKRAVRKPRGLGGIYLPHNVPITVTEDPATWPVHDVEREAAEYQRKIGRRIHTACATLMAIILGFNAWLVWLIWFSNLGAK